MKMSKDYAINLWLVYAITGLITRVKAADLWVVIDLRARHVELVKTLAINAAQEAHKQHPGLLDAIAYLQTSCRLLPDEALDLAIKKYAKISSDIFDNCSGSVVSALLMVHEALMAEAKNTASAEEGVRLQARFRLGGGIEECVVMSNSQETHQYCVRVEKLDEHTKSKEVAHVWAKNWDAVTALISKSFKEKEQTRFDLATVQVG